MKRDEAIKRIAKEFKLNEEEVFSLLEKKKTEKESSKTKTETLLAQPKKTITPLINTKTEHTIPDRFLFTEKDMRLLNNKIMEVHKEIERLGDEIGKSCDETETFHDNFDYEECGRQQKMWTDHLKHLQKIRENSRIVKTNGKEKKTITIGSVVEIKKENGDIIKKRIGSYICFSKNDISYNSPLGRALIGKMVGETIMLDRKGGKQKILKITPGY